MISLDLKDNLLKLFGGEVKNENEKYTLPALTLQPQVRNVNLQTQLNQLLGTTNYTIKQWFTFNDRIISFIWFNNQSAFVVLNPKLEILNSFTQWRINNQIVNLPQFQYVTLIKNQLLCVEKSATFITTIYQLTPFWDDYIETFLFTNQWQKLIDLNNDDLFADWNLIRIKEDLHLDQLNAVIYSVSDIDRDKPVFKFFITPLIWGTPTDKIVWYELFQTTQYDGGLEDFNFFIETTNDGNFIGELVGSYHEAHQQIAYVPTKGTSFTFNERDLLNNNLVQDIITRFNQLKTETIKLQQNTTDYRYVKWQVVFDGYKAFNDGMWLGFQDVTKYWDGPWGSAQDQLNQQRPPETIIEQDFDAYEFHFTSVPNDDWVGSNQIWQYGSLGGWLNEKQNHYVHLTTGLRATKPTVNDVLSEAIVIGSWVILSLGGNKPSRKWVHWDQFNIQQSFFKKTVFNSRNQIAHMKFWTKPDQSKQLESEITFFQDYKAYSEILLDHKTFYLCVKQAQDQTVKQMRFNVDATGVSLIYLTHDQNTGSFTGLNWLLSLTINDHSSYQLKPSLLWMSSQNELKLAYRTLSLHYLNRLTMTSIPQINSTIKHLIGIREQNLIQIIGIDQTLNQAVIWQHSYNNQLPTESPYQFLPFRDYHRDFLPARITGSVNQDLEFDGLVANIPANESSFIVSSFIEKTSMNDQDVDSWSVWSATNHELLRFNNHVIRKNRNEVVNLNFGVNVSVEDLTDGKTIKKTEATRHLVLMFSTKGLSDLILKNQFKFLEFYDDNDQIIFVTNPQPYFLFKNQKLYCDLKGVNGQGIFVDNKLIKKVVLKNDHHDELMVKMLNVRPGDPVVVQFKVEVESF